LNDREKARSVEDSLINAARSGRLAGKVQELPFTNAIKVSVLTLVLLQVSEEQLIAMLEQISGGDSASSSTGGGKKKISIQRRNYSMDDEDEDDDADLM
jgi:DNA-binding TFAR19-related protein (PDSD5 family)